MLMTLNRNPRNTKMPMRATTPPTTMSTMAVVLGPGSGAGVGVGGVVGVAVVAELLVVLGVELLVVLGMRLLEGVEVKAVYSNRVESQPRKMVLPPLKRYLPTLGDADRLCYTISLFSSTSKRTWMEDAPWLTVEGY